MANSSDDFSQVISEEVTCPVCLEELKEPKILNCSHNICRECLELMTRKKNVIDIVCPTCRKPTPIPKGGVGYMPTNAVIVRVVEATLARKAKIEMKNSLTEGKPMVELLAKKISDFDKPLKVLNEIHEKADQLVDVIRNQEASLCREVEQLYGIKCETINGEKNDLGKLHSSASRSVQDAETILGQSLSDPTTTINVAKSLKEQIEEITALDLNQDTSTLDEDVEFEINGKANINIKRIPTTYNEKAVLGRKDVCSFCGVSAASHNCIYCSKESCGTCRISYTLDPCVLGKAALHHFVNQQQKSTSEKQETASQKQTTLSLKDKMPDPLPHGHVTGENYCEFCGLAANLICRPCLKTICDTCKHIYAQDLCPPTKREHQFENINEQSTNTNDAESKDSRSPWLCELCTFLNSSSHRICAVCATSRGVNQVALPKSGYRKCRNCTYANEQGATVCKMCSHKFGLDTPEFYT